MLISRRSDEDAIIRDARAEIVRLRGEVNPWQHAVDQQRVIAHLGFAADGVSLEEATKQLGELIDWHIDVATDPQVNGGYALVKQATATAMPNGVEELVEALEMPDGYEVQEFLPGGWHYAWTRSDGERMVSGTTWNHPALAAIAAWQAVYDRAADNRDAAGVVPAWIATWMADREILPDDDGDGISEGALVEALNNHERELLKAIPKAPAAVPAGDAECSCDELTQEADGSISGLCSVCLAYLRPKPVQAAPQEGECASCETEGVFATDGSGPFDCYACGKKAARPSARELGAAGELGPLTLRRDDDGKLQLYRVGFALRFATFSPGVLELERCAVFAALQHRGDSQEVGRG